MAHSPAASLPGVPLTPAARLRSLARAELWLPDLPLAAALVTFLYVLFLFQGYTRLFRDSDAGWHIRSGEEILRTLRLPITDPYSFSHAGEPWMNWEWLADAAAAAAHGAGGLAAVAVLYAAAIAAGVWCWFGLQRKLGTNFLLACALAIPLLGTVHLHWLARPHVFGWILILAALWWAESAASRARLALFVAGTALWANVHASFWIAPALALLYGVARLVSPWIWPLDRHEQQRAARYYLTAAALSALASLANPYGWRLHTHVAGYLADSELLASIGEFQSFNFHAAGAWQILLALGIAAAGTMLALANRRLDHFLLGAVLLALALRSARGLPMVALLLLPLAGAHLTGACRSLTEGGSLRPALRGWLRGALDYGDRLAAIDRRAGGAVWILPVVALALAAAPQEAGFPASEFPVAAAGQLERLVPELFQPQGRLLAPDKFGGYLIYRFDGRLKVFFDGRSDFYGGDFLREYRQLVQVRPGWANLVERYGLTHALLPNDYSLVDTLQRAGWNLLYRDQRVTLLKR